MATLQQEKKGAKKGHAFTSKAEWEADIIGKHGSVANYYASKKQEDQPRKEAHMRNMELYMKDLKASITLATPDFIIMVMNGNFTAQGLRCKNLKQIPKLGLSIGTKNADDNVCTTE